MTASDSYCRSIQDDLDLAVSNAMRNRSIRVFDSSHRGGASNRSCQTSVKFADQKSDKNLKPLRATIIGSDFEKTTPAISHQRNIELSSPEFGLSRRNGSVLKRSSLKSERKPDSSLPERHRPEENDQHIPNLEFVGSMIGEWTSAILSKIVPEKSPADETKSATHQPRHRAILV